MARNSYAAKPLAIDKQQNPRGNTPAQKRTISSANDSGGGFSAASPDMLFLNGNSRCVGGVSFRPWLSATHQLNTILSKMSAMTVIIKSSSLSSGVMSAPIVKPSNAASSRGRRSEGVLPSGFTPGIDKLQHNDRSDDGERDEPPFGNKMVHGARASDAKCFD